MFNRNSVSISTIVLVAALSCNAFATSKNHPYKDHMKGHPRQDEVNKRADNETARANEQEKTGQITAGQANKMDKQDKAIYQQEQADKKFNGGNYITKGQQAQLNKEENQVNREDRRDVAKDHPRQAEVNGRVANQTGREDRQAADGKITQGQASKMEGQDKAVFQQEQADKKFNGGDYITKGQKAQLNKEENQINREDRRDVRQDSAGN
jgi:hypothetical protein